jgi:5'-nucleotidase
VQYRSATGTANSSGVVPLAGSIPAHGYYLVQGGSNGSNGAALPAPDATGGLNPSGTTGTIALVKGASAITLPTGSIAGDTVSPDVIDLLGYGTSNTFEGAPATAPAGNTDVKSLNRTSGADSDSNGADFTLSASITPTNTKNNGTDPGPEPTPPRPDSDSDGYARPGRDQVHRRGPGHDRHLAVRRSDRHGAGHRDRRLPHRRLQGHRHPDRGHRRRHQDRRRFGRHLRLPERPRSVCGAW